jgi:hypothetical protein
MLTGPPVISARIARPDMAMVLLRITKAVLLWLICAGAIAFWISGGSWGKYSGLVRRGVPTQGIVEKTEPNNHAQVRYFYDVGGQRYFGVGRAGFGNPSFDLLKPGVQVLVFYDPEHPDDSCLGSPTVLLRSESAAVLQAAALAAALVVISIYTGTRRSWKFKACFF